MRLQIFSLSPIVIALCLILFKQFFVLLHPFLHRLGHVFIVLGQCFVIGAGFGALHRLGHVHRVVALHMRTGSQQPENGEGGEECFYLHDESPCLGKHPVNVK